MLIDEYSSRVASGQLKGDASQHTVIERLEELRVALNGNNGGWLDKFRGKKAAKAPRGLYIWGPVGGGKTMLMDLFFASVGRSIKRRVHFHAFMADVHQRLHLARKSRDTKTALHGVARRIGQDARLLCLDEMQITDIADAMLVGRLFEDLITSGSVIVTTANVPPDELYKDGLNRQLFLPFIKLIEERLDVVSLDGATDYRLGRVKAYETFVTPLGPDTDRQVQRLWERLTDTESGAPLELDLLGRKLHIPQAARGCARFTFSDLCGAPLGPNDYLALASEFRTIFVEHIPPLGAETRNEARRLIILIDTLYDNHVRLIASSEKPPEHIYPAGERRLDFSRTVSRLQEMRSASWWGSEITET